MSRHEFPRASDERVRPRARLFFSFFFFHRLFKIKSRTIWREYAFTITAPRRELPM